MVPGNEKTHVMSLEMPNDDEKVKAMKCVKL
jgi:hypothetical protein